MRVTGNYVHKRFLFAKREECLSYLVA